MYKELYTDKVKVKEMKIFVLHVQRRIIVLENKMSSIFNLQRGKNGIKLRHGI